MSNDSERPFQLGDVIAGKYRIEAILGEGGMGIVAAAKHLQLDQLVAIKFVRLSMIESKMVVDRFLREARAAVRLKSEHAARVLDVDTLESGVPYMVMEYLEGSDLAQVLKSQGRQPVDIATGYVVQACEAVAEAHARGIVHRDLKPQNLFLTTGVGGAPLIKVLDFGISKMADDYTSGLTNPQMMLGSPQYMAPEQMRASPKVDARADVWSLGVVLFRLLSSQLPFGSGPMPELCLRVINSAPVSLTELVPELPAELAAIVARCLEKDPAKRYATAGELAGALEPFVHPTALIAARRAQSASPMRPSMLSIPPASQDPQTSTSVGVVSAPHSARRVRALAIPALLAGLAIAATFVLRAAHSPVDSRQGPATSSALITGASASSIAAATPGSALPPPELAPASPPAATASAPAAALAMTTAPASSTLPASHARTPTPPRSAPKPSASSAADDDIPSFR